ncbi:MAG: methyltransferase [Deltaproteobacteria bacterium]|nr:methyltransferase [Deltaproteobacteria bacterium]
MKDNVAAIKSEFLKIAALLENLSEDQIAKDPERIYRSHFEGLNQLAATEVPHDIVEKLLADEMLLPVIARISHLRRLTGLGLEAQCAKSVVADSDPWARIRKFPYYANYLVLAHMEVTGAKLKPRDRIVFLGSGPLPLSLISLAKGYEIEGMGIEQDEQFSALSREVVRKLGLEHSISVLHGNHFSLPLKEYANLIMVGADASPKDVIFAHLSRILSPDQLISYRIYEKGLRRLLDNQSMVDPPPEFIECARIRPVPPVNNTSVFAVKAPGKSGESAP